MKQSMAAGETEIDLLERIVSSPKHIRQRDLAHIIGLSLGMTNTILKRLVRKGLLKIKKVNNRNIQYIVSPQGMERIVRRSYRYFRRTIKNVVQYKNSIEELLRQVADRGYREVILVGSSDLDFMVEHLCAKQGLRFRKEAVGHRAAGSVFRLFAESQAPGRAAAGADRAYLGRIVTHGSAYAQ